MGAQGDNPPKAAISHAGIPEKENQPTPEKPGKPRRRAA